MRVGRCARVVDTYLDRKNIHRDRKGGEITLYYAVLKCDGATTVWLAGRLLLLLLLRPFARVSSQKKKRTVELRLSELCCCSFLSGWRIVCRVFLVNIRLARAPRDTLVQKNSARGSREF